MLQWIKGSGRVAFGFESDERTDEMPGSLENSGNGRFLLEQVSRSMPALVPNEAPGTKSMLGNLC
jgi:hypothetical protein